MSNKKPNRRVAVVPDEKTALNKELAQADQTVLDAYWKRNISLTLGLLAVWFVVGYLLAIVFAPALNAYTFLGAPLGFWIAQNGAIYVFVVLILIYALRMNQMDKEFGVEE
jgi:putative solute:sodium symporter small subunit